MSKVRLILMDQGRDDWDFICEMELPRIDEIISHRGNHYEVKFIQYMIEDRYSKNGVNTKEMDHILVTGIKI